MRETFNTARLEIDKTNSTIASYQEEFSKLKQEINRLQEDLRDKNAQLLRLKEEKHEVLVETEECKKREVKPKPYSSKLSTTYWLYFVFQNKVREELSATKKYIDQNKIEIRNFYQGQVEVLVQNKLKEFQSQLEKHERNYHEEIKRKELSIAKIAALHLQEIAKK